jgi:ribosomal protein L25 (general stress protein Ctc)
MKLAVLLMTALLTVLIGVEAFAELKVQESVTSENTKPYVKKERFITKMGTVEAVDLKLRVVTLKGDKGKIFDVRVVPEVKNLAQLKKGDLVAIRYHEAVSAQVYKAGQAPRVTEAASALETAKAGEKPGGKYLYKTTTTATIESINMKKPEVTLKTLDGKTLTVKVERPKLLANVKVGDEVVITYSEAVAVSVTKKK